VIPSGARLEAALRAVGRHVARHWPAWTLGSLVLFLAVPEIDLTVAGWFHEPAYPGGWPYARGTLVEFVRKGLPTVLFGVLVYLVIVWLAQVALRVAMLPGLCGRVIAFLLASLALGPGLIVNALLKEHWGRARPSQIADFGGEAAYTPPFVIAPWCESNCSFVSGHGSLGFWVVAFAFLAPAAWRARAVAAALLFGGAVAFVRIVQGGHFLSDTVYAGVITVGVTWLCRRWLLAGRR